MTDGCETDPACTWRHMAASPCAKSFYIMKRLFRPLDVTQTSIAMMRIQSLRTVLCCVLLFAMAASDALAQHGLPQLSLEIGPAFPVGRDAGFDFRAPGLGAELTASYDLTGVISLKGGAHASVSPFDEQFHRQSYHFPLESPDRISARSSSFLGAFAGTEVTAIRTGGFAVHFGGVAGYGLLVMPPLDYELLGSNLVVARASAHGLTVGGSAGMTLKLADGVKFRLETGTRAMRFSGDHVGELPVAGRAGIREMTFRIGLAGAL
jgi:hypothetical protein